MAPPGTGVGVGVGVPPVGAVFLVVEGIVIVIRLVVSLLLEDL